MAKVYNGGVTLPTGFKLNDPQPIADYMVVEFIADLATLPNQFEGMVSYVLENQTLYVKKNATWEKVNDLPSPLVSVTEGGNTGIRRAGFNPANYGNIGQDAVDLSISTGASTTRGATRLNSFAEGENTTASGQISHAEGLMTTASGTASHAEGLSTIASGQHSHAEGNYTIASGGSSHTEGVDTKASEVASHAEGESNFARSRGEHSGGRFGTDYTPNNDGTDRIVNYGNGDDSLSRSDAFTIFRNGAVRFFRATLASITNATSGFFIFDSGNGNRPTIHNGTEWKPLAYVGEGGGSIIEVTYSQLTTAIANSTLVEGQVYLLTDYMTTYIQPNTGASKSSGIIEQLYLTAIDVNKLHNVAKSKLYPEDIVYYEVTGDIGNNYETEGFTKGKIYRRIDTIRNNDIGTDWRHVKYDRGGVDKLLFENYTGCANNVIQTYFLFDNVVGSNFFYNTIGTGFHSNTIGTGFHSNTIGTGFYYNTIGNYFISNTIGNEFNYNTIGADINNFNFSRMNEKDFTGLISNINTERKVYTTTNGDVIFSSIDDFGDTIIQKI